jgi:hypothetical protein
MTARSCLAAILALAAFGCGSNSSTTASGTVTETFSGNLAPGSTDTHAFTVAQSGTVQATLTALAPQSTIQVGLGIGQVTSAGCALLGGDSAAKLNGAIVGAVNPGPYCVAVFDVGNVSGTDTYTVQVIHP